MADDELKQFVFLVLGKLERMWPTIPNGNTREALKLVHIALHDAIDEMDKKEAA